MIIRSFAELRPRGRVLKPAEIENPALRHVQAQERKRERERAQTLNRLLPETVEMRPERRQEPIPDHAFKVRGQAPTGDYGAATDWGQLHELKKPHKVFFKTRRGASVTLRTGANLHVELPPGVEGPDNRLLNAPVKSRSIRKTSNGGRLKLTGAAHGAYRFHPSALGE